MRLHEVFDRAPEIEQVVDAPTNKAYLCPMQDGRWLFINFTLMNPRLGLWGFAFDSRTERDQPGRFDATGEGNQTEIFSTAVQVTRQFVDDVEPMRIGFTATKAEESRVRLYSALTRRLVKGTNYVVQEHDIGTEVLYEIVRKDIANVAQ